MKWFESQRGIALPMAMMIMTILTSLMLVFASLGSNEVQIGASHQRSAQARALAESGIERVIWALSVDPSVSGALVLDVNHDLPNPLPLAYDGSTPIAVGDGGGSYKVSIAPGAQSNEKIVTAWGFINEAERKIVVTLTRLKWIDPVCALCAGGENPAGTSTHVQIGGNATVNASTLPQGGTPAGTYCPGVNPTSAVASTGTVTTSGTPNITAPTAQPDTRDGASFPSTMLLSDADMLVLKSRAKASGSYYQGSQNWTTLPKDGLIFVDTLSGNPLSSSSSSSDLITVSIGGGGEQWSGWLVVVGSISITGQTNLRGLIYAQNDISLHGTGNGAIQGAVISTNRIDSSSTTLDSADIGNSPLVYDCMAVRDAGGEGSKWSVKPGTFREVSS